VPRKNLRPLGGVPLVAHVARTARQSSLLDQVFVNTESPEIAEAAAPTGVETYLRCPTLAASHVTTDEILYDFALNVACETIVVINPTAPFLKPKTIDGVLRAYFSGPPDVTLFTTTRLRKHLIIDGQPTNFEVERKSPRTQDLEPFDYINFIVFAISRAKVMAEYERKGRCLYASSLAFFPMQGLECHDIDDEDDFLLAELLLRRQSSVEKPE
jgi:CMP-N,N'-diacetyllegionaminic acid synthase